MKRTDEDFYRIFRDKLNEVGHYHYDERAWKIVCARLDRLEKRNHTNLKPELMTHYYQLTGLTCDGCVATVKKLLGQIAGVQSIEINAGRNEATLTMSKHISTDTLKAALASHPKYAISDRVVQNNVSSAAVPIEEEEKSWFATYKPLLIVFAYITGIALLAARQTGTYDTMRFMQYFMAGFFLAFSFFKLLDLSGFADSYSSYDLLAKRWRGYGLMYPFIELALGIAYLVDFKPIVTNIATIVVMGFSTIGVLQSVLKKRKIRCACLGAVFNLPMSTVTIIEDLLMVGMAIAMLFWMN